MVRVRNGRPDLPAGYMCVRAQLPAAAAPRGALGALSRCQRPAISARTLWLQLAQRPVCGVWVAFGDVRGCWGCCVWRWAGAETWWAVRFEWSTGFEFLTVSPPPPAAFRCQLISQRQSRDRAGPGRTLVCLRRAPGARAVPLASQGLTLGALIDPPWTELRVGPGQCEFRVGQSETGDEVCVSRPRRAAD